MSENVGTPDNQRGVFSPQLLIGSFGTGHATETVTMPANTESLLIINNQGTALESVVGTTSGYSYPFFPGAGSAELYVVEVSPVVDPEVTITWFGAPGAQWYVIADAGVRVVNDAVLAAASASSDIAVAGIPTQDVLVAGLYHSGGTYGVYPVAVDATGHLVPLGPTLSADMSTSKTVLTAPSSGAYYLFGIDIVSPTAASYGDLQSPAATEIAYFAADSGGAFGVGSDHVELNGFRTTGTVVAAYFQLGANTVATLRYALGP
jgi:hypothetical protein